MKLIRVKRLDASRKYDGRWVGWVERQRKQLFHDFIEKRKGKYIFK